MQAKIRELGSAPFENDREISEEDRIEAGISILEAKRSKLKTK